MTDTLHPPPVAMIDARDLPESFDDDLGWILSKYVERTGATGGALTIHREGQDEGGGAAADLLYAYGAPAGDEALVAAISAGAAGVEFQDRRGEQPVSVWSELAADGRVLRALMLAIAGDAHQRIVLTTLHAPEDAAPGGLSEAMALRLQPVLAGYFKLWLLNRAQRRRTDALASALNRTDIGILLLDAAGHLAFLNDAGRGLLDDIDGVRRVGRGIAATDVADALRLREAIEHVAHRRGDPEAALPIVPLRRRGDRRALIAAVMPVERAPANPTDPVVILYLFSPDMDVGALLAPVCKVYGLSPAETRLVGHLAEGLSVTEAAERMRVKVPTLRTYLKQIFAKTGAQRQGDLIRLMMTSIVRTRGPAGQRLV